VKVAGAAKTLMTLSTLVRAFFLFRKTGMSGIAAYARMDSFEVIEEKGSCLAPKTYYSSLQTINRNEIA
jgi:hypothetical protein